MIIYTIAIIIGSLALLVMIYLVAKKFVDLAALNVDSVREERVVKVKNRIMLERLKFNWTKLRKVVNGLIKPLQEKSIKGLEKIIEKINELEKKSDQHNRPLNRLDIKQRVDELLKKANELLSRGELEQAEKKFIEILDLDSSQPDAFEGLAEIYLNNKDYKKARETCRFYLKLLTKKTGRLASGGSHRIATCYADLGEIYQAEGKNDMALKNYQKSLEIEPSNPRFLDLLLKISILLRNKDLAWQAFNRLKETDPENQKLTELRQEVEEIESMPL